LLTRCTLHVHCLSSGTDNNCYFFPTLQFPKGKINGFLSERAHIWNHTQLNQAKNKSGRLLVDFSPIPGIEECIKAVRDYGFNGEEPLPLRGRGKKEGTGS